MSLEWAKIGNGATFEAFINALLTTEDPTVRVFGRPGPDAGLDAVSKDGRTAVQAKFHSDQSARHAFTDAKRELEKIRAYRGKGHRNYTLWKDVEHWTLVTNVTINPQDELRWTSEIVPLFQELDISAELCSAEKIEARALKHPFLIRAYFDGENRCFLTLSEAHRMLRQDDGLREGQSLIPLQGREAALGHIANFIAGSSQWLLIQGPGGIGKTRLMYEAGVDALSTGAVDDVYWGVIPNLQATLDWYSHINPERNVLLLLDEPDDPTLIARVRSATVTRARSWKIIVAVRRSKDPIIEALRQKDGSLVAREVRLQRLSEDSGLAVAKEALQSLDTAPPPDDVLKHLVGVADGHPIWLSLGARLIAKGKSLSELVTQSAIATLYVDEIVTEGTTDATAHRLRRDILRWLCLLQPLNLEGQETDFAATQAGVSVQRFRQEIASFTSRRAVVRSGWKSRVAQLKPDVIREHILLQWLAFRDSESEPSRWQLSEGASQILELLERYASGTVDLPKVQRVLGRLWVIEHLTDSQVDLLSHTLRILGDRLASATKAEEAELILETAAPAGRYRPAQFAALARSVREANLRDSKVETPIGTKSVKRDAVVMEIAWPLFLAGTSALDGSARDAVIRELAALAEEEHRITSGSLPNDGHRAGALVSRLISSTREVLTTYDAEARKLGLAFLDELHVGGLTPSARARIDAVLAPQLEIERREIWNDGDTIVSSQGEIAPGGTLDRTRKELLEKLWLFLEAEEGDHESRLFAWSLLRQAGSRGGEQPEIATVLERILRLLSTRKPLLSEALAMREIWEWHLSYDKRDDIKALAEQCEQAFRDLGQHETIMDLMLSDYDEEGRDKRRQFAEQHAEADDARFVETLEALAEFAANADDDGFLSTAMQLAGEAGSLAVKANTKARRFSSLISDRRQGEYQEIVLAGVRGELFALREAGLSDAADSLLRSVVAQLGESKGSEFLGSLYVGFPLSYATVLDLQIFEEHLESLQQTFGPRAWQGLGHFLELDEGHVFDLFESAWNATAPEKRSDMLSTFCEGLTRATWRRRDARVKLSLRAWERLVDFIWSLPSIDRLVGNLGWHLDEFAKEQPRLPFVSLVDRYAQRLERAASRRTGARFDVSPYGFHLRDWYESPDPASDADVGAVRRFLERLKSEWPYYYWTPIIVHEIDPKGILVPDLVVEGLSKFPADKESLRPWARVAGYYAEDGVEWRRIAIPICQRAGDLDEEARESIYGELADQRVQSWVGAVGQLHPRWQAAVDRFRSKLHRETEDTLREYWAYRLRGAEWDLERAKGELEEEHYE